MASTFKSFLNSDITTTRTMLHEAVPVTGSILARTYGLPSTGETNIKTYGHQMFVSVYDYPFLSSSSNHLMDITFGTHPDWDGYDYDNAAAQNVVPAGMPQHCTNDAAEAQFTIRKNIYTQMQQLLVGHDQNGNLRKFDRDGNFSDTTDDMYHNCVFISLSRLLVKDEIKKGTFRLEMGAGRSDLHSDYGLNPNDLPAGGADLITDQIFTDVNNGGMVAITDSGAQNEYRTNSPVGEYAVLNLTEVDSDRDDDDTVDNPLQEDNPVIPVGLIYYQAGIIVLNMDWMTEQDTPADPGGPDGIDDPNNGPGDDGALTNFNAANFLNWYWDRDNIAEAELNGQPAPGAVDWNFMLGGGNVTGAPTTGMGKYSINALAEGFRFRINRIQFQNTTELNSTIYFCRANHNEFNYSGNPSYLKEGSKICVKENTTDSPISFITTVGLYSPDQELLAVAKLSEPLKKDPSNELTLRVRLDY